MTISTIVPILGVETISRQLPKGTSDITIGEIPILGEVEKIFTIGEIGHLQP